MKSNLPSNDFTGELVNDSCKKYFGPMKMKFSKITCPNDIRLNGRNTFGSVGNSAHRGFTPIPRLPVLNLGLYPKLHHDTMCSIFIDTKIKSYTSVSIRRVFIQCSHDPVTKERVKQWSFWNVVEVGTWNTERPCKGSFWNLFVHESVSWERNLSFSYDEVPFHRWLFSNLVSSAWVSGLQY